MVHKESADVGGKLRAIVMLIDYTHFFIYHPHPLIIFISFTLIFRTNLVRFSFVSKQYSI